MKPRRKTSNYPLSSSKGSCGKFGFDNKKEAKASLRRTRETTHTRLKPGILNVYRCWKCNQWHIGHNNL